MINSGLETVKKFITDQPGAKGGALPSGSAEDGQHFFLPGLQFKIFDDLPGIVRGPAVGDHDNAFPVFEIFIQSVGDHLDPMDDGLFVIEGRDPRQDIALFYFLQPFSGLGPQRGNAHDTSPWMFGVDEGLPTILVADSSLGPIVGLEVFYSGACC
jgi:hypothetical protein